MRTVKALNYAFALATTGLFLGCAPPDDEVGYNADGVGPSSTGEGTNDNGQSGITTGEDGQYKTPGFSLEGETYNARTIPLTNSQWNRSVQEVLQLPEEPTEGSGFTQPPGGFHLFTNNEEVLIVDNTMRENYQLAAATIASKFLDDAGAVQRVGAGMEADSFIRTVGRRAFRRPLTEEEVSEYQGLYDIGTTLSGDESEFQKGASLVIEGLLQSPNFLYRSELEPAGEPLTGFEMAAKLSLWLLQKAPDDELLDRAAAGELDTAAGVSTVVNEMLETEEASNTIVELYSELLSFSRYNEVIKSDPSFSPDMKDEMFESSELFFKKIFETNEGLASILTSTEAYVGPQLAQYYGITPAPAQQTLTDLGPSRPGYFSQVPYLMVYGDGNQSDAIHRGVALNYKVLCAELPIPNFQIPKLASPDPDQTSRQRIEEQTGVGSCPACHGGYINPLGFAFENFDGLGRERETDNGLNVDTVSAYPFADDVMTQFNGAPELMQLLAENPTAHQCFVKGLASYGLQRDIIENDLGLLNQLASISQAEGSIKDILRAIATSPEFSVRPGAI